MRAGLFHYTNCGSERFFRIGLIRAEWEVNNYKAPVNTPDDRRGMIDDLIQRNGKRSFMSGHYVRSGIANKYHINACSIEYPGKGIVISSDHGDLLSISFHFL